MNLLNLFRKKENFRGAILDTIKNFMEEENVSFLTTGLHHVDIEEKEERIYVDIHLYNPAPLIGRGGHRIHSLGNRLSRGLDRKVNVNACKYDLWSEA